MGPEARPEPLFNSHATVEVVAFDERHFCLVVDEALSNPDALVDFAKAQSGTLLTDVIKFETAPIAIHHERFRGRSLSSAGEM